MLVPEINPHVENIERAVKWEREREVKTTLSYEELCQRPQELNRIQKIEWVWWLEEAQALVTFEDGHTVFFDPWANSLILGWKPGDQLEFAPDGMGCNAWKRGDVGFVDPCRLSPYSLKPGQEEYFFLGNEIFFFPED